MIIPGLSSKLAQLQAPDLAVQPIQAICNSWPMSLALERHLIQESPMVSLLRIELLPVIHRLGKEGHYVRSGGVVSYDHDDVVLRIKLLESISGLLCCWRVLVEGCFARGDFEEWCLQGMSQSHQEKHMKWR